MSSRKRTNTVSTKESKRFKRLMGVASLIACLSLVPVAGHAEGEDDVLNEQPYELDGLQTTAQKREENVQKVPASVDIVTGRAIEEAKIENTRDMARYTPNVFVQDNGSYKRTAMRGVSSFINSLYGPVAMYVDDVNIPLQYGQDPDLFDIERAEVLKGPQGTLYGRNSEAGVINIVTKKPGNEVHGKLLGEFSLWDTDHGGMPGYKLGAAVNGPLVNDKLFISLAGKWKYDMGYVRNDTEDRDNAQEKKDFNLRGQIRWTPTDRLDISFLADVMNGYDQFGYGRYIDGQFKANRNHIKRDADGNDIDTRYWHGNSQSLRIAYSGEDVDFLSITSRRYFGENTNWDLDSTPRRAAVIGGWPYDWMDSNVNQDMDDYMLSQEFRLSSSKDSKSPLQWLLGAYGFIERLDASWKTKAGGQMTMDMGFGPMAMVNGFNPSWETNVQTSGVAVFGQATYTIADKLHITAGLRYEHNSQWGEQKFKSTNTYTMAGMGAPGYPWGEKATYSDYLSSDVVLPKLAISYDFTDNVTAYASVSRGYLAGGFDTLYGEYYDPQKALTYDPEFTWNYEIGLKTSWLDNKLVANLAGFYIDMYDKQVSTYANSSNGLVAQITNADRARSYGLELELRAMPMKGLEFFGGIGWTQTEILDWKSVNRDGLTVDFSGNELPFAPKLSWNVGAKYQHDSGFYGRVDVTGYGEMYYDQYNTDEAKEDPYALVNARLGWTDGQFDVSLWCKNIFNVDYKTSRATIANYGTLAFDGDPRQFGMTVSYEF